MLLNWFLCLVGLFVGFLLAVSMCPMCGGLGWPVEGHDGPEPLAKCHRCGHLWHPFKR